MLKVIVSLSSRLDWISSKTANEGDVYNSRNSRVFARCQSHSYIKRLKPSILIYKIPHTCVAAFHAVRISYVHTIVIPSPGDLGHVCHACGSPCMLDVISDHVRFPARRTTPSGAGR